MRITQGNCSANLVSPLQGLPGSIAIATRGCGMARKSRPALPRADMCRPLRGKRDMTLSVFDAPVDCGRARCARPVFYRPSTALHTLRLAACFLGILRAATSHMASIVFHTEKCKDRGASEVPEVWRGTENRTRKPFAQRRRLKKHRVGRLQSKMVADDRLFADKLTDRPTD